MAVSFARFSWCLWGRGKDKEPICNGSSSASSSSSMNSSSSSFEFDFGLREQHETVQLLGKKKIASSTGKVKRKWQSREERRMRMEREFDFVMVPSDGGSGCLSGSDSDESDMSIGWMEPHGPSFRSENEEELDNGFAVLVPCYSPGCKELVVGSNSAVFRAITNLPTEFSPDCKNYMEQVLLS